MCDAGRQELTSLYRLFSFGGRLLYIGITNNFTRRLSEHQSEKVWGRNIETIRVETFYCRRCAEEAEREAIILEQPQYNIAHNYDEPIMTSRWRTCLTCRMPTAPYEDSPEDKTWSWISAYRCARCGTHWSVSWNYPIGDQVMSEERLV